MVLGSAASSGSEEEESKSRPMFRRFERSVSDILVVWGGEVGGFVVAVSSWLF